MNWAFDTIRDFINDPYQEWYRWFGDPNTKKFAQDCLLQDLNSYQQTRPINVWERIKGFFAYKKVPKQVFADFLHSPHARLNGWLQNSQLWEIFIKDIQKDFRDYLDNKKY